MHAKSIRLLGNDLILLPEKAVFLPEYDTLCIADWHLGKALHFRKAGIALPQPRLSTEFDRLEQMITGYGVQKVVLLGDLFHSQLNSDWQDFALFVRQHTTVEWLLTVGNHDIIPPEKYHETGILYAPEYRIGNSIICRHEPEQKGPRDMLQLTGHIHPGYTLHAAARMQYRFPCFYYDTPILTLPAFGGLTGLYPVEKNTHNRIFVVVEDAVKEVK